MSSATRGSTSVNKIFQSQAARLPANRVCRITRKKLWVLETRVL